MGTLLEVKDLKVQFDLGKQIITGVDGASLCVCDNEVVVLAGESGSGKSVTALSLTRILPGYAKIIGGSVRFKGRELLTLDENALCRIRGKEIAYIFQEPSSFLNPVYTVGKQVAEAIMLHQNKTKTDAYKEAENLLGLVRIHDPQRVMDDYPHQLSGGMNQRVFIAMSLACKPRLLIADEPTTALDVTIEAKILDLLLALKNELRFSLLFITHNLSIAKKIADTIFVMYAGKTVEEGSKDEIFSSPRHFHTKELIAAYEKIGKL